MKRQPTKKKQHIEDTFKDAVMKRQWKECRKLFGDEFIENIVKRIPKV